MAFCGCGLPSGLAGTKACNEGGDSSDRNDGVPTDHPKYSLCGCICTASAQEDCLHHRWIDPDSSHALGCKVLHKKALHLCVEGATRVPRSSSSSKLPQHKYIFKLDTADLGKYLIQPYSGFLPVPCEICCTKTAHFVQFSTHCKNIDNETKLPERSISE